MAKDKIDVVAGLYTAFNFEALTINASSTPLTASKYTQSDQNYAKRALITCETGQCRYKYNGDNPTSTEGHILNSNSTLTLIGATNIRNFRVVRTGASAKLMISYEK